MLIQLCYASRRVEFQNDLLQDLSDILAQSRAFNQAQQIFGVLYYAEGKFFQCLEGEKDTLESLFLKIFQDQRHTDVIRFEDREIDHVHFARWSMKYVNQHGKIHKFFKKQGLNAFVPEKLDTTAMHNFLDVLLKVSEADEKTQKSGTKKGLNNRGYQNFF